MVNMRNDAEIPYSRHWNLEKTVLSSLDGDIKVGGGGLAKNWPRRRIRDSVAGGEREWKRREASTTTHSSSASSPFFETKAKGLGAMVLMIAVVNG